jgi:hypothetical protein
MYLTRILLSIVFVLFASTALAVEPEKTIMPNKDDKGGERSTSTESAPVAAVNVDPDRDAGDCVARPNKLKEEEVYKTVDENGNVVFVDEPIPGIPPGERMRGGHGELDRDSNRGYPAGRTNYESMRIALDRQQADVRSQITPEESASAHGEKSLPAELTLEEEAGLYRPPPRSVARPLREITPIESAIALEPSTEMPKTQGMNVTSRMMALRGGAALAQDTFRCTVESAVKVGADGKFVDDEAFKVVIGDVISIDRQTGKIEGTLSNYNSNGEARVLDFGSKAQKFKAITVYEPNIVVDYIEITTWDHKPFVYKKRGTVLTGRCE